jgi:hypothetical protein
MEAEPRIINDLELYSKDMLVLSIASYSVSGLFEMIPELMKAYI